MRAIIELSLNQVVAYNVGRLRWERRWSEEKTAKKLGALLGRRISIASYSAMERSVEGRRIKRFDADELFAFARVFGVTVWDLLWPPINYKTIPVRIRLRGAPANTTIGRSAAGILIPPPGAEQITDEFVKLVDRKTRSRVGDQRASRPAEPPLNPADPLDAEVIRVIGHMFRQRSPQTANEAEAQGKEILQMFQEIAEKRRGGPGPNEKRPRRRGEERSTKRRTR